MAISNYTELTTSVKNWMHRSDDLNTEVAEFIQLTEADINRQLESRLAENEVNYTLPSGQNTLFLPSGFWRQLMLWLTEYTPTREIHYINPEDFIQDVETFAQPWYYTIKQGSILFEVKANQDYTLRLRYKKGYDIANTGTNDILSRYPDLYLFGALAHASMFLEHYDKAEIYGSRYNALMRQVQDSESDIKGAAELRHDGALVGESEIHIFNGGFR